MLVTPTTFTLAEYCQQMNDRTIVVNHDYQRSPKIWPAGARSYLIDTILEGYPIPKLILSQSTDLATRKTIKEIVDGQQRSQAILDFYNDKLKLSGRGNYVGATFSTLDKESQEKFVNYQLGVDLLVGASPADIREIFRRMNAYTVPLNPQERRHAVYQGFFKWFVASQSEAYAETFKKIGVFSERKISRMDDAEFITEIIFALENGLSYKSQDGLGGLYRKHDSSFDGTTYKNYLRESIDTIVGWAGIHNGELMKSYNFYSLVLALIHVRHQITELSKLFEVGGLVMKDENTVLENLQQLIVAIESPEQYRSFGPFVDACSASTTKKGPREVRFKYLCEALTSDRIG